MTWSLVLGAAYSGRDRGGLGFEEYVEKIARLRLLFLDFINGNARDDRGYLAALPNPVRGL